MSVNIAINPKRHLVVKDDFLVKTGVIFQILRSPVNDQTALTMVNLIRASGLVGSSTGVGSRSEVKFAKFRSAKGRVLVHHGELIASGSPTLSRTEATFSSDLSFF